MEKDILKQLYQKYRKEIYLYLYSLCKNSSLAEDLLQETFLKALLSLPDDHTNMRAWLYLVARNLFFNYYRREKEKNQTTAERSIYYNKDHQVVDDNNTFLYESEDGNRSLEIGVRTMESGIITEFEDDDLKTSEINNREVTIARLAAEDECYLAIFTKEGVTFTIQTKNLTEEELLMVLRELC